VGKRSFGETLRKKVRRTGEPRSDHQSEGRGEKIRTTSERSEATFRFSLLSPAFGKRRNDAFIRQKGRIGKSWGGWATFARKGGNDTKLARPMGNEGSLERHPGRRRDLNELSTLVFRKKPVRLTDLGGEEPAP